MKDIGFIIIIGVAVFALIVGVLSLFALIFEAIIDASFQGKGFPKSRGGK